MSRKHHADRLQPSPKDVIQGPLVVKEKWIELERLHRKQRGTDLVLPAHLQQDRLRFIALMARHAKLDFRHKPSELQALKAIAEWTLYVNADLRNQQPNIPDWLRTHA